MGAVEGGVQAGGRSPLVGRAAVLGRLTAALDAAMGGRGQVVVVEGPAGIGKSRLLAELVAAAGERGLAAAVAGGQELGRHRPFGVLADAFGLSGASSDARRVRVTRLLAGGEGAGGGVEFAPAAMLQFRIMEALRALVDEVTAEGPLLVAVDDLQWADAASLAWLHGLALDISELPLTLVCALREVPASGDLAALLAGFADAGGDRLVVEPLDARAALDLAGQVLGGVPGARVAAQVARCGGNPLLVVELLSGLRAQGALTRAEGAVDVDASVPVGLGLSVLQRLRFLPAGSVEVLRVASVLGQRFSVRELSVLSDRTPTEVTAAVEGALRAQVLVAVGDELAFRHDLLRESLYEDLPAPVRAGLHAQFARAVATADGATLTVAAHYARGAQPGDTLARHWLQRAATELASRSPGAALELCDRALQLCPSADPARVRLQVDRAAHLFTLGRLDDAAAAVRALLSVPGVPQAALRLVLVQILVALGRADAALDEARTALAQPDASPSERAHLLAWQAHARFLGRDLTGGLHRAEQAVTAAEGAGDVSALMSALAAKSSIVACSGRLTAGVELAAASVRLTEQVPDGQGYRFHAPTYLGALLLQVGRMDEAERALRRGRQRSEQIGAAWNLPVYQFALVLSAYLRGAWDDAIAEYEVARQLVSDVQTRHFVGGMACRALIALHRDDLDTARRIADQAARDVEDGPGQYGTAMVRLAQALLADAHGDGDTALAVLHRAWAHVLATGFRIDLPYLGPDLARLAVHHDDPRLAGEVVAHLDRLAADNPDAPPVAAAADCARGWAAQDPRALARAAEAYRQAGRPHDAAAATEGAATLLDGGDRGERVRLLTDADTTYRRLGAHRAANRVDATLRRLGVRRGPTGPRRRDAHGWDSLTATETTVARLVADGLSNPDIAARLYVSRRTVQTHVSHILAKLDLKSRVELAARHARRT